MTGGSRCSKNKKVEIWQKSSEKWKFSSAQNIKLYVQSWGDPVVIFFLIKLLFSTKINCDIIRKKGLLYIIVRRSLCIMKCPPTFIHHTMKLIASLVKETKIISSRMSSKKGQTVCGLNSRPYHTFDGIFITFHDRIEVSAYDTQKKASYAILFLWK